jgi:hypothetical protein
VCTIDPLDLDLQAATAHDIKRSFIYVSERKNGSKCNYQGMENRGMNNRRANGLLLALFQRRVRGKQKPNRL